MWLKWMWRTVCSVCNCFSSSSLCVVAIPIRRPHCPRCVSMSCIRPSFEVKTWEQTPPSAPLLSAVWLKGKCQLSLWLFHVMFWHMVDCKTPFLMCPMPPPPHCLPLLSYPPSAPHASLWQHVAMSAPRKLSATPTWKTYTLSEFQSGTPWLVFSCLPISV